MPKSKGTPKGLAEKTLTPQVQRERKNDERILKALRGQNSMDITALARRTDLTMNEIDDAVDRLREANHEIKIKYDQVHVDPSPAGKVSLYPVLKRGGKFKVGLISDNQLSNMTSRLDVLHAAYDRYEAEGITDVYHAGNVIDGYCRFNVFEIVAESGPSLEAQCRYAAAKYPKKKSITTHFITGECHEGWYAKTAGFNVGLYMENAFKRFGREDLSYIGHLEADVAIKIGKGPGAIMRLVHPLGGTAYAVSYKTQKWAEALQGGEKPQMVLMGHYHKAGYFIDREVHCVLAGTTSDQSSFMRSHLIPAHVGFWVAELGVRGAVIDSLSVEFTRFYDKGYYQQWARVNPARTQQESRGK